MRKMLMLLLLFSGNVHAADFAPTPMTISVQPQIEYSFDGSPLEIPFTLTGKSGAVWLVINTHGQADNIVNVKNGYLGWHYVNKIDTTVYISDRFERQPGENTIVWDGRDENGNIPGPGTYDYYLWGYDDKSDRELVCNYIQIGYGGVFAPACHIYENGTDGMPLSNPLIMGAHSSQRYEDDIKYKRSGTHFKWTIGSDPLDVNLFQTTLCEMYYPFQTLFNQDYSQNPEYVKYSCPVFDPRDFNTFYHLGIKVFPYETADLRTVYMEYGTMLKWEFVPDGTAVIDNQWFGWDKYMWKEKLGQGNFPTCYGDNNYIYITMPTEGYREESNSIRCVSYEGDIIFDKTFHEWFTPDTSPYVLDADNSIDEIYSRQTNRWFLLSYQSCFHQMINTSRLYGDPDDETDMVVFTNSNGDYFMDNGWSPDSISPWFCLPPFNDYENRFTNRTQKVGVSIDSNNFNIFFVRNYGITSFGVSTQDGTGIGYMNFGDDAPESNLGVKGGGQLCDGGSQFDGFYLHGKTDSLNHWTNYSQTYYVAFDSAHGMITNNTAVETKNPIQFKVSQNIPNPFNPSTTISFSIPEKSHVSVDIYNITGQKIKTLINGQMSAGEHSVRWDADGYSAGVYFYKVKAGKFEKTMRMTLVR